MKRSSVVPCPSVIGLLVWAGLSSALAVHAQSSRPLSNRSDEPVRLALGRTIEKVKYRAVPLHKVFDDLRRRLGVDVSVEWEELENAGVERGKPISLALRGLPVEAVLRFVLQEAGGPDLALGYEIRDGTLLISASDTFRQSLTRQEYAIGDLLRLEPERAKDAAGTARRAEGLGEVLIGTVEPDCWAENGGLGTIRVERNTLVVENHRAVHEQIGTLLDTLRTKPQAHTVIHPCPRSLAPRADEVVRAALGRPLKSASYREKPLDRVIGDLQKQLGVNVYVSWQSLEDVGIERDKPVSLNLARLPAERVVRLLMAEVGCPYLELAYEVRDGVLVISTREQLGSRMELHACPLHDFARRAAAAYPNDPNVVRALTDELTELLIQTVEPDSWADNGGLGTLETFNNILFARNHRSACDGAIRLLGTLRDPPAQAHSLLTPCVTPPEADEAIRTALRSDLPEVAFDGTRLSKVLDDLIKRLGINAHVYWRDLEDAGVEHDLPVRLKLSRLPAERVLRLILDDVSPDIRIGFEIRDGVLEIATEEWLLRDQQLHVYRVGDVIRRALGQRADDPNRFGEEADALISTVIQTVEPDCWADNGGLGTINWFGDVLICRNSSKVCRELDAWLSALRSVPKGGCVRALPTTAPPAAVQAARTALRRRLPRVVYSGAPIQKVLDDLRALLGVNIHVGQDVWKEAGARPDTAVNLNLTEATLADVFRRIFPRGMKRTPLYVLADDGIVLVTTSDRWRRRLINCVHDIRDLLTPDADPYDVLELIINTIEPDTWADNGGRGTLCNLGDWLCVRNTEPVQREVLGLLHQLRQHIKGAVSTPSAP